MKSYFGKPSSTLNVFYKDMKINFNNIDNEKLNDESQDSFGYNYDENNEVVTSHTTNLVPFVVTKNDSGFGISRITQYKPWHN